MTQPVRLGIVGLGRMGRFHASALTDVAEIEVTALADPVEAAVEPASTTYPGAATFTRPHRLVESGVCEAVLVASPTSHHPRFVQLALEAGLHVLCEKPLALDPDLSDRLGAEASARDLVLQVGFWRRFSPPWSEARRILAAGDVGRPVLLRLSQWDADPPPPEFCDPAVSGGLAVDCGVHEFDLVEWLTGASIEALRAESLPTVDAAIAAVGDVDNLLVTGRLTDGSGFVVDLSRNGRYGDDVRTEVLASDGALFVETLPEAHLRVGRTGGLVEVEAGFAPDAMAAGVRAQAAAFARAVRGEEVDVPGAEASSRAVRAGLAALRSLAGGAGVDL